MCNYPFASPEEFDDLSTREQYARALAGGRTPEQALAVCAQYSRDNARTPMQWTGGAAAGFTTGTPWLPVNPNYPTVNAEAEQADPNSVLAYYKKLIALRKDPALAPVLAEGPLHRPTGRRRACSPTAGLPRRRRAWCCAITPPHRASWRLRSPLGGCC